MRAIGHFIGGKEVKGVSGRTGDVFEPMTGDVQAKVALASKAEVRAAVENARAAQPEWAATNPQRRGRVMMKFLELVQRTSIVFRQKAALRERLMQLFVVRIEGHRLLKIFNCFHETLRAIEAQP